MARTDAELVAEALTGNQSAYREIVDRHGRSVFNLASRLLRGDHAAAEDIAQETFLKAFQRLGSFDRQRRLAPWLLRIAHNRTIDVLRQAQLPTAPLDDQLPVPGAGADGPGVDLERSELRRALEHAIDRLRPGYQADIVLRYQEDLSYAEVAHVMGVPEGTAKTYVRRARRELAEVLAKAGYGPS